MRDAFDLAQLVASVLDDAELPWAVVGGIAVSLRAEPRFTRDLDVVVAVAHDTEAEAVVSRLRGVGFEPFAFLEHAPTGRLATVQTHHGTGVIADVLLASSGIEDLVAAGAERLALPPLTSPRRPRLTLVAGRAPGRRDARRCARAGTAGTRWAPRTS